MFTSAPRSAFSVNRSGEADVVAGGEAERHAVEFEGDGVRAGVDRVRLRETEGVEQVDLVVAGLDAAAGDQQGVAHLGAAAGGPRSEHPGDDHDIEFRGEGAHAGCPRTVQWFGDIQERIAESPHGGFREHHQVRAAGLCLTRISVHEDQIRGQIAGGDDLG